VIDAHPSNQVILCIDDDDAILWYEQALLERSGYAVMTTASVHRGLELATTCEFDVVLIDYEMPDMNGSDLAFEIRRTRPEVKIILLSGTDVPPYALAVCDAFVPKLETSRTLLPMIAELCGRSKATPDSHDVNHRAWPDH
jgi:CheY-like chemotaxis protein